MYESKLTKLFKFNIYRGHFPKEHLLRLLLPEAENIVHLKEILFIQLEDIYTWSLIECSAHFLISSASPPNEKRWEGAVWTEISIKRDRTRSVSRERCYKSGKGRPNRNHLLYVVDHNKALIKFKILRHTLKLIQTNYFSSENHFVSVKLQEKDSNHFKVR